MKLAVIQKAKDGILVVQTIIDYDHSYTLNVECNRLLDIGERTDVQPGWRFDRGWLSPPPKPESEVSHGG